MNFQAQKQGMLDKALSAYQSYSDRNPSDPSGYLDRFQIFVKKQDYDKAADELAKIYGIYPKYPNLHYYKGALYSAMGNHKVASEEYETELKNNPGTVPSEIGLGKELLELGDYNGALGYFNQAMQSQPRNAEAKQYSGYANYLLKNYQGAVALYRAALAFDKGNPLIYKRLGLAYRAMGDNTSAAQAFRQYLDMEPDAPDRNELQRYL
jgi:tetratricopeptide (TPR) repeat protein